MSSLSGVQRGDCYLTIARVTRPVRSRKLGGIARPPIRNAGKSGRASNDAHRQVGRASIAWRSDPLPVYWMNAVERWLNTAVIQGSALRHEWGDVEPATMRICLSVLLLLFLLPSYSGEERLSLLEGPPVIHAHRVDLDWRNPARRKLGALTFLGGVHLTSPDPEFGGFSAMSVVGDRFTLLSDGGNIVNFRLDSRWRLSEASFAALPDGPGRGWSKLDRDSESLTRDPVTGQFWVGFERANQIWRYSSGFARTEAHAAPSAMVEWSENGGAESLVRLRDGSFIVLAESVKGARAGTRRGLWFAGDPVRQPGRGFRFSYRPPPGYRPTDMTELPDGRLLVLNRKASLRAAFTVVVTLIERRAIRPGQVTEAREIARFAAPVVHDNFEAVAAVREGKDTILWIASDDNHYAFQRSLLLKFRLND